MSYDRMQQLASILVNYSCEVSSGENVLIETKGVDTEFINILIQEVFRAGGKPFVRSMDARVNRELIKGGDKDLFKKMAEYEAPFMGAMQAYIGVRGGNNSYELSDVDPLLIQDYSKFYSHPIHHEIRVKKTKWVILRYPTEGMSQLMGMSTEGFADFFYKVCCLDYKNLGEAMLPLKALMERTDKVRITGKGTDITFSIKDIPVVICKGDRNIPDGEIYTAPVKDSVNGIITFNVPSIMNGVKYENVCLKFMSGKIIEATANHTDKLNAVLNTDEGARYIGEFALGVNPHINNSTGDILFDEKIGGSIHFTPGACYDEASNGNTSAIHWDMVLIQTAPYGGGNIYFDDVLIRQDGFFTEEGLKALNPVL